MLDHDFLRRLKSSGFVERVYIEFRQAEAGQGDRVLDPSLAFLLATIVRDQRIAEALLRVTPSQFTSSQLASDDVYEEQQSDLLEMLGGMLGRSWAGEVIGQAAKGLSKTEARMMGRLKEIVAKSRLVEPGSFQVGQRQRIARSTEADFLS